MLKRIQSFDTYEIEWQKLPRSVHADSLFLSPLWLRTWWDVFGSGKELHILSLVEGEDVLGLAPLMMENGRVSFLTDNDISDYFDFQAIPGQEEALCRAVVDYLDEMSWHRLELRNIPKKSSTLEMFPAFARKKGWQVELSEVEVCPITELPASWDEFLSSLSKKDRHELRRKIRRLEAHDGARYFAVDDSADIERNMDDFLRLHRLSQREKAEFMTDEMEKFFRLAGERFLDAGIMKLYLMEVDGQRVSSAICFEQNDEVWLYNSGFDPSYGWLSVGLLLKAFCLKDAIEEGKKRFDFLRGKEPYKYDLGARDMPIYALTCVRD